MALAVRVLHIYMRPAVIAQSFCTFGFNRRILHNIFAYKALTPFYCTKMAQSDLKTL